MDLKQRGAEKIVSYDLLSRVGCRDNNEDNVGMFQAGEEYCFALADGLGGHGKGEVASGIAVEQAVAAFAQAGEASEAVIHTAFQNGQEAILEAQKADLSARDMKTTFVYLLVGKEEIRWAHMGIPGCTALSTGNWRGELSITAFPRCWWRRDR